MPIRYRAVAAAGIVLGGVLVGSLYLSLRETDEHEGAPRSARVIDELRGAYRGVGIGDSAAEIQRVFGRKRDAGDGPFTPLGAGGFGEVGGPTSIRYPAIPLTPRNPVLLRYQHVSFKLLNDKVFALIVTEPGAATEKGIAIGQELEAVDALYDDVDCDEITIGDFGATLPRCTGKAQPGRHIWFGRDPIRSITIATLPFD